MANPTGSLKVSAGGSEYTLFVGMSVLAEIQDKHGQDILQKMEPPEGAPQSWMPDLSLITDLFLGALQRHHADVADRWLVDDILAENAEVMTRLMGAAFPDPKPAGNGKRPKGAAA